MKNKSTPTTALASRTVSGRLHRLVRSDYTVTAHAERRWSERFPDKDMDNELRLADRPASKKVISRLIKSCPEHATEIKQRGIVGRQVEYQQARCGAIFVIRPPLQIVTVLDSNYKPNEPDQGSPRRASDPN